MSKEKVKLIPLTDYQQEVMPEILEQARLDNRCDTDNYCYIKNGNLYITESSHGEEVLWRTEVLRDWSEGGPARSLTKLLVKLENAVRGQYVNVGKQVTLTKPHTRTTTNFSGKQHTHNYSKGDSGEIIEIMWYGYNKFKVRLPDDNIHIFSVDDIQSGLLKTR